MRAFTIIEMLVYLALLSLLMGGTIAAVYGIVESSGRNQARAMIQEEGTFLTSKINWAMSGSKSIDYPPVGENKPSLAVTKWDSAIGAVTIQLAGTNMTLTRGTNAAAILNNANVSVSDFHAVHVFDGGTSPEYVTATFTLTARAPNGMPISQSYSTTNYVRR